MSGVFVAQSWGLSAGLPSGHEFALKNGFYPLAERGWRVGTSGVVRTPDGGAFAMTVLTDGNPTEDDGIVLVEAVAARINATLTVGAPIARPVDDLVCIGATSDATWNSVGAVLDVADLELLRSINGGEAVPLSGQRICAP